MAQLVKVTCRGGCRGLVFRIAATWVKRAKRLRCPVCRGIAEPDAPAPVADAAPKRRRPGPPLSDEERADIAESVAEYVDGVIGDINRETAELNRKVLVKRKLPPPPTRPWTPPPQRRLAKPLTQQRKGASA